MSSSPLRPVQPIEIVNCHAAGEVGDVIVAGVDAPPGRTLWEQSRWIAADETLRNIVLQEPRGGVFKHVNLLVPPVDPRADAAFIIMEPTHTPPMSGSNAMCVATVLLETGLVEMVEPTTEMVLEAPAGLVEVKAECYRGKVVRVALSNVASFVDRLAVALDVDGIGTIEVDTAYGGDSFVMVDADRLGVDLVPEKARQIAELGVRIARAATDQLGFRHPNQPDWKHVSFCQFAGPLERAGPDLRMRNAVVVDPGKVDRSPTGTGVSARLALLRAKRLIDVGQKLRMQSIIGSEFTGVIERETTVGNLVAVVPRISGQAWISGTSRLVVHPDDPWPTGYRLSDTWPDSTPN